VDLASTGDKLLDISFREPPSHSPPPSDSKPISSAPYSTAVSNRQLESSNVKSPAQQISPNVLLRKFAESIPLPLTNHCPDNSSSSEVQTVGIKTLTSPLFRAAAARSSVSPLILARVLPWRHLLHPSNVRPNPTPIPAQCVVAVCPSPQHRPIALPCPFILGGSVQEISDRRRNPHNRYPRLLALSDFLAAQLGAHIPVLRCWRIWSVDCRLGEGDCD
jgi:hypothetical protein